MAGLFSRVTRFLNPNSEASDPGRVTLSISKLRVVSPELFDDQGKLITGAIPGVAQNCADLIQYFSEHLMHGDSRAAVVLSTEPYLLVAAYTDELDYDAVLEFPSALSNLYQLKAGSRLLTINTYRPIASNMQVVADLKHGPKSYRRYSNFVPLIAEFLSDDLHTIQSRKSQIQESEWSRAVACGSEFLKSGHRPRLGNPCLSHRPRGNN